MNSELYNDNVLISSYIYEQIRKRCGTSKKGFYRKNIHPILFRDLFGMNNILNKRKYDDIFIPNILNNISFNTDSESSMITSISSFRNLISMSNTKGYFGIYNIDEMIKCRDLNSGKGPIRKYPLGYVLTNKEKNRLKKGRSFKLNPINFNLPGKNGNHRGVISNINLSPYDGQLFITSGWDGYIKVWDTSECTCVITLNSESKINFSSINQTNTNIIGLGLQNSKVRLVDLRIGQFCQMLHLDSKITKLNSDQLNSPITNIAWREDSDHIIASASSSGYIGLWDLRFAPQPYLYMNNNLIDWDYVQQTNHLTPLLLRQQLKLNRNDSQEIPLGNKKARYEKIMLNQDERKFLEIKEENQYKNDISPQISTNIFGIDIPETIGYAHECRINHCSFLMNGRYMISSGENGTIKLWNALNGKNCNVSFDNYDLQNLWEEGPIDSFGYNDNIDDKIHKYFKRFTFDHFDQTTLFHPNGNDIGIWNIRTGKCLKRLSAHIDAKSVSVIHLNSYNKQLVSGDQNGNLLLWKLYNNY